MRRSLRALELALQHRAPEIAAALRPGLTPEEFEATSSRLSIEIPDDLEALYLWHDGMDVVHAGERAQLFPGGQMLPLDEARKSMLEVSEGSSENGRSWDPNWLPIFTDNLGGWHVVVCGGSSHPVLAISAVDLPDSDTAFASLERMIAALERRWRTGAFKQGLWGTVDADLHAVAALYRSEDATSPNLDQLLADINEGSLENHLQALSIMRTRLYPDAVPGLIRLLEIGTPTGRKASAELLGSIGDTAARPALQKASHRDPDELVRLYATRSLDQLTQSSQSL